MSSPGSVSNRRDASLSQLVTKLATDSATLVRDEITLAKREVGEKAAKGARAASFICIGLIVAIAGLLCLLAGIIVLLAFIIPLWVAAVSLGVSLLIISGAVLRYGIIKLREISPKPVEAIQVTEEEKEWLKR